MVNRDTVNKLVAGAWSGIEVVMQIEKESGAVISPGDIVSAALTLASRACEYACSTDTASPEEVAANKLIIRNVLQQMMLKTSDNLKVF